MTQTMPAASADVSGPKSNAIGSGNLMRPLQTMSTLQGLADLWRHEGVVGYTRGIASRVAWIGLGGFVFFGSYETFLSTFMKRDEHNADDL